jgi:hypothetical protein
MSEKSGFVDRQQSDFKEHCCTRVMSLEFVQWLKGRHRKLQNRGVIEKRMFLKDV